MMGGPQPGQLTDKVAAHVKSGHHVGPGRQGDRPRRVGVRPRRHGPARRRRRSTAALDPFALKLRADAVAVHELVRTDDAAADDGDEINRVLKYPQRVRRSPIGGASRRSPTR